ncbi:sensor domain-containing protein [Rhizobium leucaenae]|uniref:Diguanylate cyclase (GGDEF)-like protein/PAS domain S-box-containing protein n=1 Tax=Rhizobium leucaenae TaxID=29450 RepID=A0A7W6ZTJ8_9HYPH|nr:EAL domain-containing protein [Rhizobium leucaenae]MBB4568369.1 diguanylate cyclase (GGDEF)-like protein/PAS domain S-box-containing protein [Rhizobium leucaenae]MBB6300472.1 diguanylate cyclase (GGDEF)-like protein/PAS domain S-box-containing protein [Rhizobium leucaenae]
MNKPALQHARTGERSRSLDIETERLLAATQALMAANAHHVADGIEQLRLKAIVHELPDFLFVKDRESRFVFANSATAKSLGLERASALTGKTDFDLVPLERATKYYRIEQEIIASGKPRLDMEDVIPSASGGKPVYRLTSKLPLRNDRGEVIGLICISRDITERKRQEHLRRNQAELLEMIAKSEPLEMILEALVLMVEDQMTDIKGSVLLLDPEGIHLSHGAAPNLPATYSRLIDGIAIGPKVGSCGTAAWRGKPVFVYDTQTDPLWEDFSDLAAQYGLRSCWSTPIMTSQGNVLGTFALYSGTVREPTERELELVAMATHIAGIAIERKRAEDRAYFMAHHDDLTGLPNRAFLKENMAKILFKARRNGRKVTVAYVDLDNFKQVNDSRGHSAGDELLKELTARMVDSLRASDMVVRLGGDEFLLVIVHQSRHDTGITRRLRELQKAITQPVVIGEIKIAVTSSIGVAAFPADGETPDELIACADAAMYKAKEHGRNRLQYHIHRPDAAGVMPLSEQEELRSAIGAKQFFLEYQPQVDVASGRIVGLEALVRWRHPRHGMMPPGQFIPLAEESGLIIPLGLFVLNEACRQAKEWQVMGLPPLTIAVNVSARQFGDPALAAHVTEALEASGLEPQWLELELTESTLMHDVPRGLHVMQALKALGVRLSIDDFGTGYSSLAALKTFPFDRLKMDRSFVEALPRDETTVAIASAVISLARRLRLAVVAEGVETDEQLEFLRQAQCHDAQGFYFSRPVGPGEIAKILARAGDRLA